MSRRPSVFQSGDIGNPIGTALGVQSNAINQRREEAGIESEDRKRRLAHDDEAAKQKYLEGFKVDATGVNTVDTYNLAELEKMKTQLSDAFKNGATISQVAPYASGRMSNITRGYTIAKNHEANIDKKLQELAKEYPSADLGAAKSHMNNEMLKDIFDYDENGQVKSYKDPSTIPLEKAYGANLENEDNLHLWNKPSGELIKHVEGLPRAAYQENEYVDKKGFKHGYNASGELSGLQEHVRGANNDITGIKYKTEKVKWGSNEIEVMPKEQFDVAISNASKKAKADFYVATNPEIEKASYMKMQAVGQPLTTEEKDVIRRKMALEMFSGGGYDKSTFKKAEKEGVPKPAAIHIHNNNGNGSGNQSAGNEFESITAPEAGGVKIENGYVTRSADGSDFTGEIHVTKENIPASIEAGIRALNSKDGLRPNKDGKITLKVADGEIVGVLTKGGYFFSKDNMSTAQRKLDAGRKDEGAAPFGGGKQDVQGKPTPKNKYKEIKTINGVKWGLKADGTIEKIG
jgi:hypothetical protein